MILASLNVADPSVIFLLMIVFALIWGLALILITHKQAPIGLIMLVISLALLFFIGVQLHVIGR